MSKTLLPNSTIGIIGGGQLARMLAMAAAKLGYKIAILEPQKDCPAAQVANYHIIAGYDDAQGMEELAALCDCITYEFENVPVTSAQFLAEKKPVFPPSLALQVAQDRLSEKQFIAKCGISTARFITVDCDDDLSKALSVFEGNGVLKTRRLGYDGKGQKVFSNGGSNEVAGTYQDMGSVPLILEDFIDFECEISIIAARSQDGAMNAFDCARNVHREGILRRSTVPTNLNADIQEQAQRAAFTLLEALGYVGVLGVEFFVKRDGCLLVNEMAPRVHNSGHWTEAACVISQFEQHMRAVAGLPLGNPQRHHDCEMENLIGDDIDKVSELLGQDNVQLHLYGKHETRQGRKMGHFTKLKME